MARIKYGDSITPVTKEHHGFVFQSSRIADVMFQTAKCDRARYQNQINRKSNLMLCTSSWRGLVPATQTNWVNFAAAFPQVSKRNSSVYLSGYQLFLKRQQYEFLNKGIQAPLMSNPAMSAITQDSVSFVNGTGTFQIDCTNLYKQNYGILPSLHSHILIKVISYATESAQFFTTFESYLTVTDLSGDKLIISVITPPVPANITYSIYLSYPQSAGRLYASSKCRYMGSIATIQPFSNIKFGLLYNWYAASHANFCPPGWHLPSNDNFLSLYNFIGGYFEGGKLKEVGFDFWSSPNSGASNETGYSAKGAGWRSVFGGVFQNITKYSNYWSSDEYANPDFAYIAQLYYSLTIFQILVADFKGYGYSVRLVKDDSNDPGSVTDYDGNVYPTVKIGDQVWLADNYICKHYNDGNQIAHITDNTEWAALTTGAYCAYDNDNSNV